MNIIMIDATLFNLLTKNKNVKIFVITLQNVNYKLKKKVKSIIIVKNVIFKNYHDL